MNRRHKKKTTDDLLVFLNQQLYKVVENNCANATGKQTAFEFFVHVGHADCRELKKKKIGISQT